MNRISKSDIEWLWVQMIRFFGSSSWRNEHGESDDGTWFDELSKLSRCDLDRGLARLRQIALAEDRRMFPIPAIEFYKHCLPTDYELGLPSEDLAYRLACRSQWDVHPIVYLAVGNIGLFNLRKMSEEKTRPWYGRNYRKLVQKVRMGYRLVIPQSRVHVLEEKPEVKKSVVTVPAKARDYISAMRKTLNG